jgi:putative sterol carrier protein
MADETADFFEELGKRGHEPLLEKATGTVRFDLIDKGRTARWKVAIKKGDLSVSRTNGDADCVVRADKNVFNGLVTGEVNPMAALLRGTIGVQGDPELIVLFQRLFPRAS